MCNHDAEHSENEGNYSSPLLEIAPNSELPTSGRCSPCKSDPMVCFCYRQTVSTLREGHEKFGSLKALQKATNIGNGCGGCRASLCSLFQEEVDDINRLDTAPMRGSTCVKPGQRLMTGFIIADGNLESRVVSCNAIAPQLGDCNSTTPIGYALLNHKAEVMLQGDRVIKTGETFSFDTRDHNLPRPFFGTFVLSLGRENFGASRFNIQWSNGKSLSSTHENGPTGRPRVFLPTFFNRKNVDGPNKIHLGLLNPRTSTLHYSLVVFDRNSTKQVRWDANLGGYQSSWVDVNEVLIKPLLKRHPNGNFGVKIESSNIESIDAVTAYLFFHNVKKDFWSCQHL